jgi:hypothetical protein
VQHTSHLKIIGVAGKAGAGKDTFYEHVLKPRGFLRWQMTLHYKVWLAARGYTWNEVFYDKPPYMRKLLQEEITELRDEHGESIWLNTLTAWMRALQEIVGVECAGIAVTDLRFLIEMRGIKAMGGRILHLEAPDQQANIAPELRGHRSETELDSPEVKELHDAYMLNRKEGLDKLNRQGCDVLQKWEWP